MTILPEEKKNSNAEDGEVFITTPHAGAVLLEGRLVWIFWGQKVPA